MASLLEINSLSVSFKGEAGEAISVVDQVTVSVGFGETLGVVGESGCGKSVTALAIMGLLDKKAILPLQGTLLFSGQDLLQLTEAERSDLRGDRMAMIFQEPMTSLNPAYQVGDQIAETLTRHRHLRKHAAWSEAVSLLARVRIPDPVRRAHCYPFELSGGMRQRVMIAMAMACAPSLLIADEPTTALDVTVQAQILALLDDHKKASGMSMILISHDLGVIAEMADRIVVMYSGQIVESAPVHALFRRPQHPYTIGLLGALPHLGRRGDPLPTIEGRVPDPREAISGCRFSSRCPFALPLCRFEKPRLTNITETHLVRCHRVPL